MYNNIVCYRCPFAFKRQLFIKGPYVGDELSFEEFRSSYYKVIPAENAQALQTPQKPFVQKSEPSKSTVDYLTTPKQGLVNEDMTVNTRGVLNEMSDIFGKLEFGCFLIVAKTGQANTKQSQFSIFYQQ